MNKQIFNIFTLGSLLLAGCAASAGDSLTLVDADDYFNDNSNGNAAAETTTTYEIPVPIVQELAPTYVAAGDTMTVYGSGFMPKRYGTTKVRLQGEFTALSGDKSTIDFLTDTTYVNNGKATFIFDPAEEGSFGSLMGTFEGYASATNQANDGTLVAQEVEPAVFKVVTKPSVVVSSIYPMQATCENRLLKRSVEGTKLGMDIDIVGFTPSEMHPVTVTTMYMDLSTAASTPCPLCVLGLTDRTSVEEEALHITTTTITDPDQLSFKLRNIDFGEITDDVLNADAMVSINVSDGTDTISRIITVTMYKAPYVVEYDGNYQVAEIFAPEAVSGCISGGDYGRNISYSEGHSESKSRSCGFNASAGLKIPYLEKILSLGFGMNVSESISSSNSANLGISGQILAHQYATIYRQTQKLQRSADVVEYNECGVRNVLGEALLTDWAWAPDIAVTKDGKCPPLPPSNLPDAKCYINCD